MYVLEEIDLPILFVYLIIRLFQLVLSVGTMFFSHNKSARTVFRLIFSAKRTRPQRESNCLGLKLRSNLGWCPSSTTQEVQIPEDQYCWSAGAFLEKENTGDRFVI